PYLLSDILRDEWEFQGFVVSDWGAVNEIVKSVRSGLELEMPPTGSVGEEQIIQAVENGSLSEEKLDEAVARILNIIQKAVKHKKENASYNKNQHHLLARAAAEESIVLLKNDDQMLPLAKSGSIAVIGEFAREARYQGSGSSHVNPNKLENALDEMTNLAGEGCSIQFAKGYDIKGDKTEQGLLEEAKELSAQADAVVLFV